MTDLTNPIFFNESKARAHLESLRWAEGRFCPHCGESEKTAPVAGKKHRPGLYYCNGCKGTFTATVGTIFERSKIPLHKWMAGFHLMAASKKGISAHQLHRMLKLTYKTAWFMAHRIREAMKDGNPGPLGGSGISVEADETFIGRTAKTRRREKRFPYSSVSHGLVDKMKALRGDNLPAPYFVRRTRLKSDYHGPRIGHAFRLFSWSSLPTCVASAASLVLASMQHPGVSPFRLRLVGLDLSECSP